MQHYANKDSPGFDICRINANSIQEMYEICRYIPYARCFNALGWVKYHVNSTLHDSPGNNLFVLDKFEYLEKRILLTNHPKEGSFSTDLPEIWVVNLERRLDRKQKMMETNLLLNFFIAVDGKELT